MFKKDVENRREKLIKPFCLLWAEEYCDMLGIKWNPTGEHQEEAAKIVLWMTTQIEAKPNRKEAPTRDEFIAYFRKNCIKKVIKRNKQPNSFKWISELKNLKKWGVKPPADYAFNLIFLNLVCKLPFLKIQREHYKDIPLTTLKRHVQDILDENLVKNTSSSKSQKN